MPVWLWNAGYRLPGLCVFIALSGLVFVIALDLWERLLTRYGAGVLVSLSLLAELILVTMMIAGDVSGPYLVMLAIANGAYNAFFWTTQRLLFLTLIGDTGSGRQYGNFQIFVAVFLKIGILVGGWLLEAHGIAWLLGLSLLIAVAGLMHCRALDRAGAWQVARAAHPSPGWRQCLYVRDRHGSAPVFAIDGLFLFLESHFWTLTLYWLVDEDYARLGVIVVVLAIAFALLFYLLKNLIDRLTGPRFYQSAVIAYALSWLLRALPDPTLSAEWLFSLLLLVSFCSSLFRLAFNKRFFDIARAGDGIAYLLLKSRASQSWLAAIFALLALVLWLAPGEPWQQLPGLYVVAGAVSLVYLRYRSARASSVG